MRNKFELISGSFGIEERNSSIITADSENVAMKLQTGRVKVDVKPPTGTKANFTVQSPAAVASVRGTSFDFDTRRLKVSEGTVSFRGNKGKAMRVSSGGESFVKGTGSAADPSETADANLQPPPPVGNDFFGGTPLPPSEYIAINIKFPEE